jgi:hypothetical protein
MSHVTRSHVPPPELQELVRECVARRGVPGAVRALGVSRGVLLAIAAGAPVLSGSLALLREAQRRREPST